MQKPGVIDMVTGFFEVGLQTASQILGSQQANVHPIEIIEFGEIDRRGRSGQAGDIEAFGHLLEGHDIVFVDAPSHQDNPVQDTFGGIAQVLHIAQEGGVAIFDRLGRIALA